VPVPSDAEYTSRPLLNPYQCAARAPCRAPLSAPRAGSGTPPPRVSPARLWSPAGRPGGRTPGSAADVTVAAVAVAAVAVAAVAVRGVAVGGVAVGGAAAAAVAVGAVAVGAVAADCVVSATVPRPNRRAGGLPGPDGTTLHAAREPQRGGGAPRRGTPRTCAANESDLWDVMMVFP